MHQPKKRWAWTAVQKRPCFKQPGYAPTRAWFYRRQFWGTNRVDQVRGLRFAMQDPDSDYPFLSHHRHSLRWTWD
jgi:hypothetical protein